jgi:signal transduction histidine kinase
MMMGHFFQRWIRAGAVVVPGLGMVLSAMMTTAAAQDQEAEGKVLPIAEINRLLTDPSSTTPREVRFSGSVIYISHVGDFCLQHGAAGVFVEPRAGQPRPRPGDRVEVSASVAYRTADLLDPAFFLRATGVRVTGPGELPPAEKVSLPAALRGAASGRRVQVEGVVMQATVENGVVRLHLTDTSGWAVVNVHAWQPGTTTRDWWGARLRITGANIGRGHSALRVTSSDDITVVTPGTAEWFAAPEADAATLRAAGPMADRLRVTGTVLQASPDEVYLRSDAGVPLRSSVLAPFPPTKPHAHPLELLAPRRPEGLKAGDRVELVGSPLSTSPFWQMSFASLRVLGPAPGPDAGPQPVDVGGKNPGDFACDLVTLTGRVRWHDPGSSARLELDSAGVKVHAVFPTAGDGDKAAETWQPGDVVRATGLLLPAEHGRPLTLQVAGTSALERLSDPPSNWHALTPLARQWIGTLAVGLIVALAVTWWMQRLVRQRTAALAGANAALQAEVAVRVKAEGDLAGALQQERELSELKSRFVSMVSHEFRTPLGITMSAVELLQHYEDRLPPEQKAELLADIQGSTKNMAALMEQVLLLGRVEAGRLAFQPRPLDLETLVLKLTDESLSATNRRCPIVWTAHNDLTGAHGDEALLRHIFSNLLSNAVKYSPPGTPVHFAGRREGGDAVLTVKDEGIGIPVGERARLFEAFHRCANVGEIPGTGLGLVIVKRCVDLHGGSIELESEPGRGTVFTVRVPLWSAAGEV